MEHKFHFTPPFLASFKETIDIMSEKLNELNTIKGSDVYGICNCSYRMRYITPKDVSTYIDYIHKGMMNNLIGSNAYDIEMFAVEAVKRFLFEHGCTPFDEASPMGNNHGETDHSTLQDILLIHSNEVYNKVVCTPFELTERYNNLKSDIKVFNDMHFPANMKKIIEQLPSLVSTMDGGEIYQNQPLIGKMFRAMVEEFIIFATTLNMITVSSMVDYCKPSSAFDSNNTVLVTLDTGDSISEQVDTSKNAPVYFVFAEGKTRFISNAIKKATDSPFSHISIAFDSKLNPMYSFGNKIKGGTYESDINGIRLEDINDKYYDDIDIAVYGAYMPNDKINEMKRICDDFIDNKDKTKFDVGILLKKLLMKDGTLPKNQYRQVCSTFVNHLLKSVDVNVTDKNIPSPAELKDGYDIKTDQFHSIYSGKAHDVKSDDIEKKMTEFAKTPNAKVINEYVTECMMLKTNEITNAHQLPFNFNIRNIVLMDSSEDFDNTLSAIKFMLNDSRSPINELLVKFASVKSGEHISVEMIKQGFITHHNCADAMRCHDDIKPGFLRHEGQWLDKIVYGSQFTDSNYRTDNPGLMHTHSIEYDISTIYRMFSCHHNDNEHLANHIVKIANVMRGLIDSYRYDKYTIRDTMCDVLAVFGEILTKDILMLYHNNNQVVVYRDDMRDTMIPGYLYCESFVITEADAPQQNQNGNKDPGIVNKSNLNQSTTMQKATMKAKELLQQFASYIQKTIQQIAPKFFEAHKSERKWIEDHSKLNSEIRQMITDKKFNIQITDYPNFNIPAADMINEPKKNIDELKQHIKTVEELDTYLKDKNVDDIAKGLLYSKIRDNVDITNDNDIRDKTRNFICYNSTNAPTGNKDPMLDEKIWDDTLKMLSDEGLFKAVEEGSKANQEALKNVTDSLQRLVNTIKKDTAPTNNNNGEQQQTPDVSDSNIVQLFNVVNRISKNCWLASLSFLMKDVYGKTYNLYRKIVMEYERQKTIGVQNEDGNATGTPNPTTGNVENNSEVNES